MTLVRCWLVLYRMGAMEGVGHMSFALTDRCPVFEITLGDLAALVGLVYPLPPECRAPGLQPLTAAARTRRHSTDTRSALVCSSAPMSSGNSRPDSARRCRSRSSSKIDISYFAALAACSASVRPGPVTVWYTRQVRSSSGCTVK